MGTLASSRPLGPGTAVTRRERNPGVRCRRGGPVVGEQDRRLLMPEVLNQELPQRPLVVAQLYPLVHHARRLELAVRHVELDRPPRRAGQGRARRQQCRGSTSEGDEGYAQGVELGQIPIGRELGIEDQMARPCAVLLLPEGDEAQDIIGLLALPEVAIA